MNSRTLDFADEILARTGGEGVDVVLNSLTGERFTTQPRRAAGRAAASSRSASAASGPPKQVAAVASGRRSYHVIFLG